jgi:hypothetical protein
VGYLRCFMKKLFTALLLFTFLSSFAQKDSLQISFHVEPYYSNQMDNNAQHRRPEFMYSYNRDNEFNINLGLARLKYKSNNVRANLGIAGGTYMLANMFSEDYLNKTLFEANAGHKISKKADIWVDAGILPSHIGVETAIGSENYTLTRSIMADNSPYYETGARLSFTSSNGKLYLAGLILNGWQNIERENDQQEFSFGHQLTISPNSKFSLNWSTFIGNMRGDDEGKSQRIYNNVYSTIHFNNKIDLIAAIDIGVQEIGVKNFLWSTAAIMTRYTITPKNKICLRVEYFNDDNHIIIAPSSEQPLTILGGSINYDRIVSESLIWRIEWRTFYTEEKNFEQEGIPKNSNNCITTSWAFTF